jgi:acyl-CoA synthetase (NDP forming)
VSLDAVLDPASVAVIGASDDPDKVGGRPLVHLARNGFAGRILPVNPTRTQVQGHVCFPDIASLPEVPEVALVIVPGESAVRAVEELAAAGTQVAVVIASGFSEVGPEGLLRERHMKAAAAAAGMRIIGPNSMGVCNFATGTVLTFTTAFIEVPPVDGPVAIVSQSGSMAVEPYMLLASEGIGIRQVHATGNDSDVSVGEMAVLAASDPSVDLLLLYLESVKDVDSLAELGRVALERDLPVIALKAGRTPAGEAAAASHTGALAGEDRVVDAFLERHGIWRARDLGDLVRATALHLRPKRPKGNSVVIISNSGASCVQSADAAELWGLGVAPLAAETRAALDSVLPGFATSTNPVDLTAALIGNSRLFADVLPPLAADPAVHAIHLALPIAGQGYDVEAFAVDLAVVAEDIPVVVSCPMPERITAPFTAKGLPLFRTEVDAIAALGSYAGAWQRRLDARARGPMAVLVPRIGPTRMLDEAASMAFVATAGLPVVEHRLCRDVGEAVAAFHELGGARVVLKGCTAAASHKSELGIVRLELGSESEVADAYDQVMDALQKVDPAAPGVIVATMVRGRRELLLGARQDSVFGPVVVVGDGGTYVEAMPDVQLLLPPFTADEVRAALDALRIAPLLHGLRGESPMDLDSVARAAVRVGDLVADPDTGVVSVELNPLLVGDDGQGCRALDAVVHVADGDEPTSGGAA